MSKTIRRGRKFRAGYGLKRPWYYWDCGICGEVKWYLNEEGMKRSSVEHKNMHEAKEKKE